MTLTQLFTNIANAIRSKKGTSALIEAEDFPYEISSISTGIDTSDATAVASDIKSGQTAYADGVKLTGILPEVINPTSISGNSNGSFFKSDDAVGTGGYGCYTVTGTKSPYVGSNYLVNWVKVTDLQTWYIQNQQKVKVGMSYDTIASTIGLTANKIVVGNTILGIQGTGGGSTYRQLQYLESTGEQYINTGVKANTNTDIEVTFTCTAITPNYMRIWGNETYNTYSMYMNSQNNTSWGFNNGSSYLTMDFRNSGKVKFVGSTAQVYYNDTLKGTVQATSNTGKNLWLFRGGDRYSKIRIQSCKIWVDNVLQRNYIPAISDNKIGLYDLVNNVLYENAGTGQFVVGPEVS